MGFVARCAFLIAQVKAVDPTVVAGCVASATPATTRCASRVHVAVTKTVATILAVMVRPVRPIPAIPIPAIPAAASSVLMENAPVPELNARAYAVQQIKYVMRAVAVSLPVGTRNVGAMDVVDPVVPVLMDFPVSLVSAPPAPVNPIAAAWSVVPMAVTVPVVLVQMVSSVREANV